MSFGLAAGLVAVTVVTTLVVTREAVGAAERRDLAGRVDHLAQELAGWRTAHSDRVVHLGRQMSRVERAVARAEDEARHAALAMDDVIRRMESVEGDAEIEVLVAQGRIPREHRRVPDRGW
jgi:hypothetical protein